MLLRLLFLFLLAYIFILLLRAYMKRQRSGSPIGQRSRSVETEEMVLDPQCQSYVPKSEALLQEGNYFCSQDCARLFLSR
jgi:hypothetical protein